MKSPVPHPGAASPAFRSIRQIAWLLALVVNVVQSAFAGSATWNSNPNSNDWNTSDNWSPATVPNGRDDIATFATSNATTVSLSAQADVDSILFAAGASAFTIEPPSSFLALNVRGEGVINDSGITQNFVVGKLAYLYFRHAATAGSNVIYTLTGDFGGSVLQFADSSSAGESTIINVSDYLVFSETATAANATIVIEGSTPEHIGSGLLEFYGSSTAGNANFVVNGQSGGSGYCGQIGFVFGGKGGTSTITLNGGTTPNAIGGYLQFNTNSTAQNATLIVNGGTNGGLPGTLFFIDNARGGKARIELFDTGELDLSYRSPGTILTVGSIEGNGVMFLGSGELSAGSSNRSTLFSGTIKDGGVSGGQGGSLSKTGSGRLTLTGANTYTGRTTVDGGKLLVYNTTGSGTGFGPVQVNRGTLGGAGTISGAVTLGAATGDPTLLTPGNNQSLGILTIQSALTFNLGAVYDFALNSDRSAADQVIANGVTIASGATLSPVDNGTAVFPPGTVFTPILNTAATAITGTFGNLPEGGTITLGSNTFQVSYKGGDGNDLTLTVVP